MPIFKSILSAVVSIALVLSPVAAANAMAAMPTAPLDAAGPATTTSSPDKPCPCCDMASKCVAATCATTCAQLAAPDPVLQVALAGHVVLTAMVAPMHPGVGRPPPPPPPGG